MKRDETEATYEGYTYNQAAHCMDELAEAVTALGNAKDSMAELGRKSDYELIADMQSELQEDIRHMERVMVNCKKTEEAKA